MIFGFLVMEATPGGGGISVLDTDLKVDFAPLVGYTELKAPPSTMAFVLVSRSKVWPVVPVDELPAWW